MSRRGPNTERRPWRVFVKPSRENAATRSELAARRKFIADSPVQPTREALEDIRREKAALLTFDELRAALANAIMEAEKVAPASPEASYIHQRVSTLAVQLSAVVLPEEPEGADARVRAVAGALRAGDWLRASQLAEAYMAGAPGHLAKELGALLAEAEDAGRSLAEPEVRPIPFDLRAA